MTNQKLELKPCPHCGGKGDFFAHHPKNTRFDIAVVAQCTKCGYERTAAIFGNDYAIGDLDILYDYVVEEWNEAWKKKNNGELKMIDKINAMVEREINNTEKKIKQYRSEQISDVHNEHDLSVANGVLIIGKYNGYKEALHVVKSYIENLNIKKASDQ